MIDPFYYGNRNYYSNLRIVPPVDSSGIRFPAVYVVLSLTVACAAIQCVSGITSTLV